MCSHKRELKTKKEANKSLASLRFHPICSSPIGHSRAPVPESEWVETAKLHGKRHVWREVIMGPLMTSTSHSTRNRKGWKRLEFQEQMETLS